MTAEILAARSVAGRVRRGTALLAALVQTARPKQWIKNLLVFTAPGAAGFDVLFDVDVFIRVMVTFLAFGLAASGTYFLNDARDAEADRLHPEKRERPIAAGLVPVRLAYAVAVVLVAASVTLTWTAVNPATTVALCAYVVATTAYSLGLKHIPILDITLVTTGFIIRAVAGGTAAEIPVSEWFLIVTSFGSLFIVAGKRHAEHLALGDQAASHRKVLDAYSSDFLGSLRTTSAAVTIIAYCLWAFERGSGAAHPIWFQLSIAPFLLAFYRYSMQLEAGRGGAPEDLVLGDHFLQASATCWLVVFSIGVYANG